MNNIRLFSIIAAFASLIAVVIFKGKTIFRFFGYFARVVKKFINAYKTTDKWFMRFFHAFNAYDRIRSIAKPKPDESADISRFEYRI